MRYLILLTSLFVNLFMHGQDLQCNIQIRTDRIQATNKEIFTDLQNSINQFMNQRNWISNKFIRL